MQQTHHTVVHPIHMPCLDKHNVMALLTLHLCRVYKTRTPLATDTCYIQYADMTFVLGCMNRHAATAKNTRVGRWTRTIAIFRKGTPHVQISHRKERRTAFEKVVGGASGKIFEAGNEVVRDELGLELTHELGVVDGIVPTVDVNGIDHLCHKQWAVNTIQCRTVYASRRVSSSTHTRACSMGCTHREVCHCE